MSTHGPFTRRQLYLAGLAVLFLCGLFVANRLWPAPYREAQTIGQGVKNFDELSTRFEDLARAKGGVYAFDVLRIATLPPNTDLHLLGHAIGDVLYDQKGIAAIADCTQEFRNACSHAVVIGALGQFGTGTSTLKLIDDACLKAPGGPGAYTMCYHGLGHGVFAYYGYDLQKTVDLCRKMGTKKYGLTQYPQCVGGSIMELISGGGHDHEDWLVAQTKYFNADPLSPCSDPIIPPKSKSFCYLYLTPRLFTLAGANIDSPDPATFPKAFSYCDAIPSSQQKLRDACFGGFGKEFVPLAGGRDIRTIDRLSNDEYGLAASWCNLAGAQDGKQDCIAEEVESVFWGGENDPAASFRFCSLVPSDLQDVCYKRLASNIQEYLSGSSRQEWCSTLSSVYQDTCKPGAAPIND